jgi:predicted RNA binding protein YcfA (HicA-like mRNA interferase family)
MGQYDKLVQRILSGRHDKSVLFSEAVSLMQRLGFSMRIKGSHRIFFKEGIMEIINLQPDGSKAKAYQVKQIRDLMVKYQLGVEDDQI